MRIALIHNIRAGKGELTSDELVRRFRDAGHQIESFDSKRAEVRRALGADVDAVVVAGGDGTVAKTAIMAFELSGAPPLFVLPLGTSNNIARTVGADAAVSARVEALAGARRARLDIGRVEAPWGERHFVEAAGAGFLGTMLEGERSVAIRLTRAAREAVRPNHARHEARVEALAERVADEPAEHFRVVADAEELSGEYLTVEALNIREIGPRIALAPEALADDAMLDLLLVPPGERAAFADYVAAGDGRASAPPGIRRRVREVRLSWPERGGHVDDEAWPEDAPEDDAARTVRISIAGSVPILR